MPKDVEELPGAIDSSDPTVYAFGICKVKDTRTGFALRQRSMT